MTASSPIIIPYTPRNFGKEYFELKGSGQYVMFAAVALGAKPSYDDWIPVGEYRNFLEVCRTYGLVTEPDVIFQKKTAPKEKIAGGKNITTTFSSFLPFDADATEGDLHVFIARNKQDALRAKRYGWYPLVVNNRFINKPYIDNIRFGRALGYPECCIDFFRKYNNWFRYSNPFEAYKNTKRPEGGPIGSYHCNNFLMDKTYSYIHHIPCSYRCGSTVSLAKKVESKIEAVEPQFVHHAKNVLAKPLVVFAEQHFIIFDGETSREGNNETINYKNAQYVTNPARTEESMDIAPFLSQGDRVSVTPQEIRIEKGNSVLWTIPRQERWFVLDFE